MPTFPTLKTELSDRRGGRGEVGNMSEQVSGGARVSPLHKPGFSRQSYCIALKTPQPRLEWGCFLQSHDGPDNVVWMAFDCSCTTLTNCLITMLVLQNAFPPPFLLLSCGCSFPHRFPCRFCLILAAVTTTPLVLLPWILRCVNKKIRESEMDYFLVFLLVFGLTISIGSPVGPNLNWGLLTTNSTMM